MCFVFVSQRELERLWLERISLNGRIIREEKKEWVCCQPTEILPFISLLQMFVFILVVISSSYLEQNKKRENTALV